MSNIISMFDNGDAMNALYLKGYGPADFETKTSPLFFESGDWPIVRKTSNKIAIYRTDTEDLLGVVGQKYKLVTHRAMIDNQRAIIERSSLDCSGIEEQIIVANNGAKCYVRHILPGHAVTTPGGDTAELSFLGTNSYDGTFSFLLSGGARQNACMNGQVWTSGAATIYKAKHSNKLNIEHAARIVSESLKVFSEQNEMWHQLSNTTCSTVSAMCWVANLFGLKITNEELCNRPEDIKNKDFQYIRNAWFNYALKLGSNKWALYNALTDWSTHAPAGRKSTEISNLQRKREEKVQQILTRLAA